MERAPILICFLVSIGAYLAFVWLFMHVVLSLRPPQSVIVVLGMASLLGLVFIIFSVASGSAKIGWRLFRMWIGVIGGGFIALGPFVILPHPVMLVVGGVLGFGFAAWCTTGKFKRMI
jgi:hypothetical protein